MTEFYLKLAYYVNGNNYDDGIKLFNRDNREYPKYSIYGLKVRSENMAKKLASLEIGESYERYKRIE